MIRLNFGVFYQDEFYSYLNISVKQALKNLQNDTNIAYELENFRIENRHFNLCVGKTVGGFPEVTGIFLKSSILNFDYFVTNFY